MAEHRTRWGLARGFAVAGLLLGAGCARAPFEASLAKGQEALRAGDAAAAAAHLRRAARARPGSAQLAFNLGMAELEAGRLPRAAAAFRRADAQGGGDSVDALLGLARVRHLQRRWDDAAEIYERALQRAGRRPDLLAAMAATELQQDRPEGALTLLTEALAQNPDESVALYNMACLQRDAFQDAGAAVAYFTRFLAVAPESENRARTRAATAVESLGGVRPSTSARAEALILKSRQAPDAAEAVALAGQAVGEDPLSADALWNLAMVLERQARAPQRAAEVYGRFYRLFPEDARVARIPAALRASGEREALEEARAAEAAGNWAAAAAAYRRVLAVDGRNAAHWLRLSNAARAAGDLNQAIEAGIKAQSLKPDDPDTLYLLAYLFQQKGQIPRAVEQYRRYLRFAPEGDRKESVRQWLLSAGG